MSERVETMVIPEGVDPARSLDGAVDPDEAERALTTARREADLFGDVGSHRERATMLALSQIGRREEQRRNANRYSRYFGYTVPQAWCADFVSWAFDRTGNNDRKAPWGYPSAVRSINAWAREHRHLVDSPRRGDIFTFKDDAHTGLVVAALPGGLFVTVEGNTYGPDAREGTAWVWTRTRKANGPYRFVRTPWG